MQAAAAQAVQAVQAFGVWQTAAVLAAAWSLWQLVTFARADADLHLLSRRRPPRGAFAGKVVWITGASQGLGEVLARYFYEQGARLILSSRTLAKLQAVEAACAGKVDADRVLLLPFDLCGPPELLGGAAAMADAAFGRAGVDYLIHNAGASQHALAQDTSAAVTEAMFRLNTLGPIALTRVALPAMLKRGKGRVVVVASMAAKVAAPGQAVYAACKTALIGYFATLHTEVCDKGVGVTICCPGPIATGTAAGPRVVYGPEGLINQDATSAAKGKRAAPARVAELVARAAYHGLDECWIARQPILLIAYLSQYAPSVALTLLKAIGPGRAAAIKGGKSGYSVKDILFGGRRDKKRK